jgi:hypothetical protein
MIDLSRVVVPKEESMKILTECRKMLVADMVGGCDRQTANAFVSAWLIDQRNILSPYASECVSAIKISDSEISLRKQYGSELYDLMVKCFNR